MSENENKLTGSQVEDTIDLCQEFDLFDFIFEQDKTILTSKEWEVYEEYRQRLKTFIDKEVKKDSKKSAEKFATSGEEDDIVEKINKSYIDRELKKKKLLLKKENREFLRRFLKIINPNSELSDIREIYREVSGKIMFLKESLIEL